MCHRTTPLVRSLAFAALLGSLSYPARADEGSNPVYPRTVRATALVRTPAGTGSAWVVDRGRRLLVTNHHVVVNEAEVQVLFPLFQYGRLVVEKGAYKDQRPLRARVVDTELARDLALLQVLDPLPLGTVELKLSPAGAEPGDRIHSVGNPAASDALWVYTSGTVRQVYRKEWIHLIGKSLVRRKCRIVETQSPVNPGDSGGPVLNDRGEVVAVVSSGKSVDEQGKPVQLITWHIDVREVKAFLDQSQRLVNPRTAADYNFRGERLLERGRLAEATEDFGTAIRLDDRLTEAYLNRARVALARGDYEAAIADCNAALRIAPQDAAAYRLRGKAWALRGVLDPALADLDMAIRLDPYLAPAYSDRGQVFHLKNERVRALGDFTSAIRLDDQDSRAYKARGTLYREKRDFDRALKDFNRALLLDPGDPLTYLEIGRVYLETGEDPKVVLLCTQALKLDPKLAPAYKVRSLAWQRLGKSAQAREDAERASSLDPRSLP